MDVLAASKSKVKPIYVSKRFEQVVSLHVLKNLLKRAEVQVPLLLGIHGPSGEGKTFQCEYVLRQMGVKRFLISGGELESPIPGQPANLIRSTYIRASDSILSGESSMAVVLLNDIDTGLGSWGSARQYTTNQQTIFGQLMHMVDYPNSIEGKDTLRIPIIITGNDFTRLYEPLVRAGRMTAFEWIPTPEERTGIVASIFPELSREECRRLVYELNEKAGDSRPKNSGQFTVAFYAHLRSTLLDEDLWDEVEKTSMGKTVDTILKGEEPDFSLGIYYERVLAKGAELARSSALVNHFKTYKGIE